METDVKRANVLTLDDWEFYVLSTKTINREFKDQKSVGLSRILRFCDPVAYDGLKEAVNICLESALKMREAG